MLSTYINLYISTFQNIFQAIWYFFFVSVSENLDSAKWLSRDLSAQIRFFKTTWTFEVERQWRRSWRICMERDTNLQKFWRSHISVMEWKFLEWRFIVFWTVFRKEGEEAFARRAHVRRVKNDKRIKLVAAHKKFIEYYIRKQPDITASTLCEKLKDRFWISVSARTVRRLRKTMGFVRKRARYCQLISAKNQKVSLPLHLYNNIRNQFDNYKW